MSTKLWRSIRPIGSMFTLTKRRAWYADEPPTTETASPDKPAPDPKQSGAVDSGEESGEVKSYPEEYVKKLRKEAADRRTEARELKERLDTLEAAAKAREEKELTEQNDWKQLAEKRGKELEKMKADLETERFDNLRTRIGSEYKLPAKFVARLQGASEDELRADAAELAKDLGLDKPTAPAETPAAQQTATTPETPAARSQSTTTAVPGGQPVTRTDADRKREYYGGANSSPMFSGGKLTFTTKVSPLDE